MDEANFEAPGKGSWELDSTHFTRPIARFSGDKIIEAFPRGFAEGTARYGLLLDHLQPALVNGFLYMQPVAYLAPPGATAPPPAPVLWLLTRLHPKMRARIATSARAFEAKQWRTDLETWDTQDKPAAIERHKAIQIIDVAALSDEGLVAHLHDCREHAAKMVELHHKYTATAIVLTGDLLAHAVPWTGATPGEVLSLLKGSSPISQGFAADELVKAGDALAHNDRALAVLRSDAPPAERIELLSEDQDVGPAVRAYVEAVRYRSVGYDVGDPSAGEMPEVMVQALATAAAGLPAPASDETAVEALRVRVPTEHRAQFDELVSEARLVNRLRDERGVYSDGWATGLARRALLEAGRRLHARGLLPDPSHAVDLKLDELSALLRGQPGPSPAEAAAHHEWRTTHASEDAPPFLNSMPAPPPPADILPPAARRASRAVDAALANLFGVSEAANSDQVLRGLSVNSGTYEGPARLVDSPADFGRIRHGDVLVTRSTSPYFNVVLPLLGAIVTDRGGQLCHAAIVAREYGIPGVVGTREATTLIEDGDRVRVDGTTGEVHVLAPAAS
ncbi:MAG TPA: PEP-utilizing enzyme [Nocardioides sp.]|uniref:PEP-utilizing enzyme n=1 Tax=Nocardioides sp. TaxID=35761 RepID=UPI002D7EF290|nr:PEP-utilizing enzyme [Nocardioides sp.]HET6652649.1 PEP-utilizing enzyme [Nocardioides sp.]HET7351233.1 PEP-utilizing enzyme [Marmoricola sp.]